MFTAAVIQLLYEFYYLYACVRIVVGRLFCFFYELLRGTNGVSRPYHTDLYDIIHATSECERSTNSATNSCLCSTSSVFRSYYIQVHTVSSYECAGLTCRTWSAGRAVSPWLMTEDIIKKAQHTDRQSSHSTPRKIAWWWCMLFPTSKLLLRETPSVSGAAWFRVCLTRELSPMLPHLRALKK